MSTTKSHTYYDFQTTIETSNKNTNERLDLIEIYFKQVLKDNTNFKKQLNKLELNQTQSDNFINWYLTIPLYKIIWWKITNANIYNKWELTLTNKNYEK